MYEIVFLYPGVGAWPPAYPFWNEKHSHLTDFIIWESFSPGNDSHLKDFNTCEVFSFAKLNEKYSHSHLVHGPCKACKVSEC